MLYISTVIKLQKTNYMFLISYIIDIILALWINYVFFGCLHLGYVLLWTWGIKALLSIGKKFTDDSEEFTQVVGKLFWFIVVIAALFQGLHWFMGVPFPIF